MSVLLRRHAAGLPPLAPGAALRWDVVRRLLPAAAGDLLEVGCGQGAFAVRLSRRCASYVGVEPDPVSFAVADERVRRAQDTGTPIVLNTTVEALEPGRTFDVVCAFEVLEHLEDDAAALTAWAERLRPGGLLVVSMPAHSRRLGPWDELVGHYRRYDPAQLPALLAQAGLVRTSVHLYGYPLGSALEAVRNRVARRRLASVTGTQAPERTASSGRQLQPRGRAAALAVALVTTPFRYLQHRFPTRGTALVATAYRPDGDRDVERVPAFEPVS